MKRLALCLALALLVLAGSVSFAEQVETIVPGTTVTYSAADIDADNSAEGFIHSLFYPSKPTGLLKKAPAKTAGSKLTGADRVMYDTMAAQIPLIASGERESTVFAFPAEDIYDKLSYTAEDLGVSSILIGGEFNQEAIDAVSAIITNIDTSNAVHALLADMPYELYWFDKSTGWSTGYPSLSGSSEEITIVGEVTVSLSVAAEYSAGEYAFNTSLGQAATQAAQNAQSIVASYAGKPDLEQLQGFKDEICALTSYNDAAAGGGAAYGNPWQLVWVFDGNETTKVVCEGYSKAFKYLVDQSSCAATARLVSGNMSGGTGEGPHMWNIVRLQNTQYLVDVTNCDEGTVGYPDELFMVSDAEGSADTNYTASGVKYTYDEDTIALYGYEALTLGSVTPEIILTLSKNEALYNEEVSLTIEAEGATDARYIRSFEATSQGSSQTVSKTVTFDEEEKVAEGKWVRASVGSDRDYIFTAEVSFDGGETWVQSEPQELTVSILGSASLTATPVAEEVYKGDSIVIQLTEVEHIEEIWPGAEVKTGDQTYVVPEELFEVREDQIILPTTDLPTGICNIMISADPENGYYETGAEVNVTILEKVTPSVSLTISPNTDLLLYQNVTYTVDAQGADKVKLVIGNDDEEIDITQQNEDGQWVLTWSSVFGGEIEVYAKASFDGGETWISSEKQTLNFEVLGNVTFKVTPDSDIVTKGEPIVIRFSEMDMISDVSNPQVYIIRDGEEIDVSVSDCITTTASEMTCDTTNLEAGTYRFGFWGLPAELGYPECYVTAEVTVVEKTSAPTVKAYAMLSDETVVPEGGTVWIGSNISWELVSEGADEFEWTANGFETYALDSTFDPENNNRPDEEGLLIPVEEYRTGFARVFLSTGPWMDIEEYTFKARTRAEGKEWSDWTEMHFEVQSKGTLAAPMFTVNNGYDIHLGDQLTVVVDAVENAESYAVVILDKADFFAEFAAGDSAGTYTLRGDQIPVTGEYTVVVTAYADGYMWNYAEQTITVLETAEAAQIVEINATNFPDDVFRGIVTGFDTDADGWLSEDEISEVTSVSAPSAGITSVKGVEYFTALEELVLNDNTIASLDVSANTALTTLGVWKNQLTELDVSKLPELKFLQCGKNQLTELDLKNNTKLTELYCGENLLETIDISPLTELEMLECSANQLSSLDVSSNLSLRTLDCGNNKLEALDVSKNTVLKELICANNQLKSLDVTTNTGLVRLACGKNQLETLDVSKNTALTDLDCSGNNLGTLDVSNNTGLTNLACQGNQIVSLNTSSNSELTHLYCGENELTSLNVSGNTKLTYLECYNNPIAELDLTLCTSLSQLVQTEGIERTHADWGDCWEDSDADLWLAVDASTTVKAGDYVSKGSGATVTGIAINEANFPDEAFRTYVAENCDDGDAVLTEDELKAVTRMNCDRLSITDLQGIEYFTSLEYLSVLRTQITGIDVSANTALVTLRCSYTPLESLDVSMLPKLASLAVDMTQLHSLDLSHNPELDTLDCVDVPITSLDVSHNPVLRRLYCDDCSFTELDVSKNPSLVILCCSNLQLTSLNLNNNPILQTLDCGKNQLTSLDISGNPELENLSCGENQLTSLDASHNPNLKIIHCEGNEFTELDISRCEKMIDVFSSNDPTDQGTYLTYGEDEYGNIQFSVDKDVAVITGASETTPVLTVSPVAESYDYSKNVEVTAAITLPDGSTEGLAERYPDASLSATLMTADGEIVDGFIVQSVSALEYTFDFPLADDDMPAGDYKVRIETNVEDLVAETNTFYYTADKANAPDPTECQVQLTVSPSVFGLNERFEMTAYVTDANGEPAEGIKVGFIVLNSDGSTAPFYTDYDWLYNVTKEDGTCGIAVTKGEESELPSGQYTVQAFIVDGTASDSKPVTFVSEDHSTHNLLKHDRVEPTYTSTGIEEYWECIVCGKLFSDAEGKNEISEPVIIPMLTPHIHTLTAHARVEATCTEDGTEAYWSCDDCGKFFSDEEAKNEIEGPVVIPAKGHTPVAIPALEATCTETGLTEGEKCSVCEAILTAQEVVPALGHAYKATFTWDGFTCTGALICEHDDKHIVPLEVEVSSAETTPAGDTTPGVRTYTATAVYEDQTYTDTKLEEIPALMVIEDGVLVEYNGTASEITVPESVSSIGEGAFQGKVNITSVRIPSSVKTISASAFAGTGLTSITIPSSVTSIGASAFAGTAITSVTIPSSVTSIGANAFAGTNITEANIGESVTSIGDGAFDAGTTINTPAGSAAAEWAADHYCTVNETTPAQHTVSLTISPNTNLLLYQDVTYTVDAQGADKVKLVFGNDDEGMDITRQNAEGQWVLTWSHVFGGEIEVYAKASFDGGETWISSEKQTLNFEVLGNVTFKATPDSDTVIKGNPIVIRFSETDKIERIGSPEVSIVRNGEETRVSIAESITMTQTEMTCDTTNLEAGTYRFGFWGLPAEQLGYPECYVTVEVNVVEETTPTPTAEPTVEPAVEPSTEPTVEPTAEPTATPVPTMPSTVSDSTGSYSIGSDGTATFSKPAGSAATVSIPATITVNGQNVRVTAIADKAFQKDKKLTTVTIGKNIKTIGKNAFANCAKLKTVKGGAAVTTIKDGAFSGCKALKTFPAMNKLQKIGANAFKGDKALAKFTLAKTVTSIGKNAFNGCAGLKTITVKTEKLTNKNVGAGAFKGINKKATFKCPKKQLKNYKTLFVKKGAPKSCKFK